ncbi:hypothetical protein NP233_g10823 [Leucocoprinus birnbaumii]|uniref:Uncharacterized protein n=1 Tax=Leucocoprinus birnbaumii TaxID=56174 RepID=A0AAD5VHZ2_9AGAR|nr:hypothetical protein NP233_g10823 [Leucocoprinus birnbaumii]
MDTYTTPVNAPQDGTAERCEIHRGGQLTLRVDPSPARQHSAKHNMTSTHKLASSANQKTYRIRLMLLYRGWKYKALLYSCSQPPRHAYSPASLFTILATVATISKPQKASYTLRRLDFPILPTVLKIHQKVSARELNPNDVAS